MSSISVSRIWVLKPVRLPAESALLSGGAVVNLRENVLEQRLRYSVAATDDKHRQSVLEKALRSVRPLVIFSRPGIDHILSLSNTST